MKVISFLLVIILSATLLSCCAESTISEEDKYDGGIAIHVKNSLLDHIKSELLQQIFAKLLTLDIPDQHISKDLLGLVTINGTLSDIDIEYIGFDTENSAIRFQVEEPNILVDLTNIGLVLNFNYALVAEPKVYEDVGQATVKVAPFNMTFGMTTVVLNGVLQTEILKFDYQFNDYSANFTGGGDVSFLLLTLSNTMNELLKEDLSPNILVLLENVVEPAINDLLRSFGTHQEILDMIVDYEFMDYPQYMYNELALVLKGEIRPKNQEILPFVDDRKVPVNSDPQGGDIQVFVSDYVVRSLLYSVYKTNLISLKITDNPLSPGKPLKIGDITILFPGLTKSYDKSTPVYFEASSTYDFVPLFKIENNETYLTLRLDLAMGVTVDGVDSELFSLRSEANMTLNYGLEDGTKIAASISSFRYKVIEIINDTLGLDPQDINAIFGLLTGVVRNYVNYALDVIDIPLPEIPIIALDLNKTYIYERNGYLAFDTTPKFGLKSNKVLFSPLKFDHSQSLMRNKYSSHDAKVELFKRLIKVTPLMGFLNEIKEHKRVVDLTDVFIGAKQTRDCEIGQDGL